MPAALTELLGRSPAIGAIRDQLLRLLSRPGDGRRLPPVLIQGETGTGKGLLTRALHRASPRASGPFVDVNCAAIPEALLEAEMFGFEKGAFTDARQAKRGLFQTAHGGTLFLDEVGLLPEALQAKLLKVIEERTVRRLGSTQSEAVDVWVVAATSVDLQAATRDHRFREDLYHRLAVLTVWLPPLRTRGDDVLLLAEHFLARACADYQTGSRTLLPDARAAIAAYPWPGNVRELANVMERVALLAEEPRVDAETLGLPPVEPPAADRVEPPLRRAPAAGPPGEPPSQLGLAAPGGQATRPLHEVMDSAERSQLLEALRATGGNISRAATRLGVSRNTLRYRMEKHGLAGGATEAPASRRRENGRPAPEAAAPAPASPEPASPETASPAEPEPAPAPPAPRRPAPVGPAAVRWQRRRVTLLAVRLAAEEADTSRALEIAVDKVRSFGGRVEALAPAGLTATFGLEPTEDAPRRAAHAAMAVLRAAEQGWEGAGPCPVRLGLHVAPLLLGHVGEATVLDEAGRTAALAAAETLAAHGEPGAVLASEAAAHFVRRRFELERVDRPGAGPRYRLGRRERDQFGPRLTRFIGRQRELLILRDLLARARAGQGQVIGVVGEAGIGKSRLLFELRRLLEEGAVITLEARCVEHGSAIPYQPVTDLVRQAAGVGEADGPPVVAGKLRAGLDRLALPTEEFLPYLLHLLGVREGAERLETLSPEAVRARRDEVVRRLAREISRQRPVLLVVEDLHWSDSASEALIGSLVETLATVPILLVTTYRPGYRPPWMDRAFATQVALSPLAAAESRAVVQSILGPAAVPVAEAIVDRAQGNPFILEELARTVGARGEGSAAVEAPVGIPDTVEEALLARIDQLPDEARQLLRMASVLGREAPVRLLREVWPEPDALPGLLRDLARLDVLHEGGSVDEPLVVFRHALTHEVVYGSLLDGERRRGHGAVGLALERLYAGRTTEVVELLAYHFARSDDRGPAVDYAIQAGEKAQGRWANAEALAHFAGALDRLAGMPDADVNRRRRIDAVLKQAEAHFALGQHEAQVQALAGIRELVESSGDARRRATWCYWTGFLTSLTGGPPESAIALCQEAVAIADGSELADVRAFAECCLAQARFIAGDLRGAVEAGERALQAFETRGDVWWACRTLWVLISAANTLGEWERSLVYCRRALDHGQSVDDLRLKVVGWWRLGWTHIRRGDVATGLSCCEEALRLGPSGYDAAMVKAAHGYGLVKAGQAAAGTAELEAAVAWFEQTHHRFSRLFYTLWLGETRLRRDDPAGAESLLAGALGEARRAGYRHLEGVAGRLLAAARADGDPAGAQALVRDAASLLETVGAQDELARAWLTQAELAGRSGDRAAARDLAVRARVTFEALGTLDGPALVELVEAVLAEPGR